MAPSRLAYMLMQESFFIEDIRKHLLLPNTPAYEITLRELNMKRDAIWSEFFTMDAMMTDEWTYSNYALRQIMTCYVVHGFHHKICTTKQFHEPNEDCMCELCKTLVTEPCWKLQEENYIIDKILKRLFIAFMHICAHSL